jgi:peptidoglycan/xylan/chitin deacetylase (PgdA/CDA1 family)
VPYGELITSCYEPGTVALTFDDGPWYYTEDLLDILRDYEAEATFFVCGGNMGGDGQITGHGHPDVLRRMVSDGHQVGTHTWGHPDLSVVGEEGIVNQLLMNEQALVQTLGLIPTYLRPPYFSTNNEVLDVAGGLGYHVVNANLDTNDWRGDYDASRQAFSEALQQGQWDGGKIVLAHDTHERTVHELAAYMIEQARDAGFRLVTVGECMGDSRENWYRSPNTGEAYSSDLARRDAPSPLDQQREEGPTRLSNSYYTPISTEQLHEALRKFGHASALVDGPAPVVQHSTLVTRAAEASDSVAPDVAQPELEEFDAPPQSHRIVMTQGPRAGQISGASSPSSKAAFGLVLALVTVFFLFHH